MEHCDSYPENFQLFLRHVDHPGDDWLQHPEIYGEFPSNGALLLMGLMPSAHKSLKGVANYYATVLMFSDQPIGEERLGLSGPLSNLMAWKCTAQNLREDSCNRYGIFLSSQ